MRGGNTQQHGNLDFVAVDFETANSFRGSPCAAGLVRYRNGEPVEELVQFMRPPEGHESFDSMNISIHGITAEMVADSPRFSDALDLLVDFIGEDVLVAHNAAFDLSVIRYAAEASEIPWPSLRYTCTLVVARRALDLPSYGLPWVANALGVPLQRHHDPRSDAWAAGEVCVALARNADCDSVTALLDHHRIRLGVLEPMHWHGSARQSSRSSTDGGSYRNVVPEINTEADPEHPLYGKRVVFTGKLDTLTRQEAWNVLASVGGIPQQGVTKATDILVIGPDHYRGEVLTDNQMTGKMAKVARMREAGSGIELMSEIDFLYSL